MKMNEFLSLFREELIRDKGKVDKDCTEISNKLEALRKKLKKEMTNYERIGDATPNPKTRKEKRVDLKMVSDILEIPINELMIYLLVHVKGNPERGLVEYHLGHVYFYDDEE